MFDLFQTLRVQIRNDVSADNSIGVKTEFDQLNPDPLMGNTTLESPPKTPQTQVGVIGIRGCQVCDIFYPWLPLLLFVM